VTPSLAAMIFAWSWLGVDVEPLLDWLELEDPERPLPPLRWCRR
jgi:hypothetical protein